jgi:hypothetical protein
MSLNEPLSLEEDVHAHMPPLAGAHAVPILVNNVVQLLVALPKHLYMGGAGCMH